MMQAYGIVYSKEYEVDGDTYTSRLTAVVFASGFYEASQKAEGHMDSIPGYKVEYIKHLGLASVLDYGFVMLVCEYRHKSDDVEVPYSKTKSELV